ncbi:hypothetical protein LTR02_017664 [Friedmanniomyces endolithicus]|nr:hypothetical protein LTR02_017664 [Friedmanniomyces endolithicus]
MSVIKPKNDMTAIHHVEAASEKSIPEQARGLTESHRTYLLARHGTLYLEPMPSEDPADPYNWPRWKAFVNLSLVSFHALMIGFMTGGPIAAFSNLADDLDISITTASYSVSVQILLLGLAPLFWGPLSERYGRRPIWLVSTLLSAVCNVGCATSKTFGQLMVARIFQSVFNAPAGAIGTAVVVELFFAKELSQKIGIWVLMVTLGNPLGPFLMGFVATRAGWRWIFYIFTIINGVQFLGYLFFSPETRFVRGHADSDSAAVSKKSSFRDRYFRFGKIPGSQALAARDFYDPFLLLRHATVWIPTLAHSIIFGFCSVLICVEIPALLGAKFNLNAQATGLNFAGNIIGGIVGEQLSGPLSDFFRNRGRAKKHDGAVPPAENRLWFSYPAFGLCIAGFVVFLVTLAQATPGVWNIRPNIGLAICAAGNQMQTTALFTYAVERNLNHSGGVGVIIILVRQVWSFIGPFWFPIMFASIGIKNSAALCSALMVAFAVVPTLIQQFWLGRKSADSRRSELDVEAMSAPAHEA